MFKKIILSLMCITFTFALYNVGQTISITDQNTVLNVCDATSEYSIGDPIKLADWNGDLNGGDYYVIWLDLSASW
jgi:hypothetical protein